MPAQQLASTSLAAAVFGLIAVVAPRAHAVPDAAPAQIGATFRDCEGGCPLMVVVPPSQAGFRIGSPPLEEGRTSSEDLRAVAVPAFAIGVHEVTVGEYMRCVAHKACRPPEWLEPGSEHHIETGRGVTYRSIAPHLRGELQPIVGVSWHDAENFAKWLSRITGRDYRLPSESEWEYAARAGTRTRFWWGDDERLDGKTMACCRGCGSSLDGIGLHRVDAFEPNPWGLKNVHGNVWEWVADYYCDPPSATPADGSARLVKTCPPQPTPEGLKVFRGGSCFYEARQMRSAMRLRNWPDFRNMTVGFRIARSLRP